MSFRVCAQLTIRKYDIVNLFLELAKSAVKEKVTRVIVATWRVSKAVLTCS